MHGQQTIKRQEQ